MIEGFLINNIGNVKECPFSFTNTKKSTQYCSYNYVITYLHVPVKGELGSGTKGGADVVGGVP